VDPETSEYRRNLILAAQKAQSDYDKAILTLTAGGLGLSLAFMNDIVSGRKDLPFNDLLGGWMWWAGALASTLFSFYTSRWSLRKDILALDQDEEREAQGKEPLKRKKDFLKIFTEFLNAFSGFAFITGAWLILQFVFKSLGGK
jgi:hypothetical protein